MYGRRLGVNLPLEPWLCLLGDISVIPNVAPPKKVLIKIGFLTAGWFYITGNAPKSQIWKIGLTEWLKSDNMRNKGGKKFFFKKQKKPQQQHGIISGSTWKWGKRAGLFNFHVLIVLYSFNSGEWLNIQRCLLNDVVIEWKNETVAQWLWYKSYKAL